MILSGRRVCPKCGGAVIAGPVSVNIRRISIRWECVKCELPLSGLWLDGEAAECPLAPVQETSTDVIVATYLTPSMGDYYLSGLRIRLRSLFCRVKALARRL